MNVSEVVSAINSTYSRQSASTRQASSFAGILERLQSRASSAEGVADSAAAERAAAVRAGLDAETLAYLDKYTEIYNKYADKYGDGFELRGKTYISGDAASEAEAQKYNQIRAEFQNELCEAGIPGEYMDTPITILEGEEFSGFAVAKGHLRGYNTGIDALFYAEKYGLAGLSQEEMIRQVMSGLKTSSANEMAEAADKLYLAGAISGLDALKIQSKTHVLAVTNQCGENPTAEEIKAALNTPIDWSGLIEGLEGDEDSQSLVELLLKAWEAQQEDDEGEKLEKLMQKIDDQQKAIREEIAQRVQAQRELELMKHSSAESQRLRALLGLDSAEAPAQGEAVAL